MLWGDNYVDIVGKNKAFVNWLKQFLKKIYKFTKTTKFFTRFDPKTLGYPLVDEPI